MIRQQILHSLTWFLTNWTEIVSKDAREAAFMTARVGQSSLPRPEQVQDFKSRNIRFWIPKYKILNPKISWQFSWDMSNSKQNLSKGILQEGHKELIGEASPTAPPSDGVPGKNWLKTNQPSFCHFCWQWKRWVFGHLWDTDCVHTTAPLPQLRPPAPAQEWGNSRIGNSRRDF